MLFSRNAPVVFSSLCVVILLTTTSTCGKSLTNFNADHSVEDLGHDGLLDILSSINAEHFKELNEISLSSTEENESVEDRLRRGNLYKKLAVPKIWLYVIRRILPKVTELYTDVQLYSMLTSGAKGEIVKDLLLKYPFGGNVTELSASISTTLVNIVLGKDVTNVTTASDCHIENTTNSYQNWKFDAKVVKNNQGETVLNGTVVCVPENNEQCVELQDNICPDLFNLKDPNTIPVSLTSQKIEPKCYLSNCVLLQVGKIIAYVKKLIDLAIAELLPGIIDWIPGLKDKITEFINGKIDPMVDGIWVPVVNFLNGAVEREVRLIWKLIEQVVDDLKPQDGSDDGSPSSVDTKMVQLDQFQLALSAILAQFFGAVKEGEPNYKTAMAGYLSGPVKKLLEINHLKLYIIIGLFAILLLVSLYTITPLILRLIRWYKVILV